MRRLVLFAVLAAALTAPVLATASVRTAADVKPTVFTDPLGDAGTAADLATVSVTNDANGLYTFNVGFATPYVDPAALFIYLDTDSKSSTGDPQALGADYVLGDYQSDHTYSFFKWNGTAWDDAPAQSTITVSVSSDAKRLTFSINKSDVDNSQSFNFFVVSYRSDASTDYDDGPSGTGVWTYTFQLPFKLTLAGATTVGGKAGAYWGLALVARRSDTGATLGGEGTITCSASSGSTKLKLDTKAFVSSGSGGGTAAVCNFKVPAKLKHKVLHGTIAVTYQGSTVSRTFTQVAK